MNKEKNNSVASAESAEDGCKIVIPFKPVEEKRLVCDVCGWANPPFTAICKKCSNYLEDRT